MSKASVKTIGLALVLAMATVAGCGAKTPSTPAPAAGGSTPAPANTTAPAPAPAKELKKVTLMLNWVPYGEHAAFYYGAEKGYFKDEGIDLTIQPGGGAAKVVQAVGAKQVTFGWADVPATINGVAAGLPVKSIGSFLQVIPSAVQFFADKGIKTPADLKGKTVGATAGDAPSQTFPAFLAANGLKDTDVTMVNIDPAGKLAALISGKVDTIIGFAHDQAPTIENQAGKPVSFIKYADSGVTMLSNGLIANTETLKDAELVKAMLRASIKSWDEAAKHQDEAVSIMVAKAEKAPPAAVMTKQFALTLQLLHTKNSANLKVGVNAEADWQATIDTMTKYTGLKNAGKPADYWDGSFAPK